LSEAFEATLAEAEKVREEFRALLRETVAAHEAGLNLVAWAGIEETRRLCSRYEHLSDLAGDAFGELLSQEL
jgi:hypothetical protein